MIRLDAIDLKILATLQAQGRITKAALAEARLSDAIQDFARAIHHLMAGIHLIRKQRDQAARWGQRPPSSKDEPEASGK